MEKPLKVFCCYARKDQPFLLELKNRLIPLQRDGLISVYADIDITPGEDWQQKIHQYLNTAHIILLLVSPDFIASEYCYSNEMTRALVRHNEGTAHVIPIILRPIDLQNVPFGKIQSLPTDAKPVTKWLDPDDAFLDVTNGIRDTVKKLLKPSSAKSFLVQQEIVSPKKPSFDEQRRSTSTTSIKRSLQSLASSAPQKSSLSSQVALAEFAEAKPNASRGKGRVFGWICFIVLTSLVGGQTGFPLIKFENGSGQHWGVFPVVVGIGASIIGLIFLLAKKQSRIDIMGGGALVLMGIFVTLALLGPFPTFVLSGAT